MMISTSWSLTQVDKNVLADTQSPFVTNDVGEYDVVKLGED